MAGIFNSLNTSTKGLMAQQTALHTTGHNLSNINTPGFTRQRVDMQADRAFSFTGVGQLGTGVRMQGVVRMINDHVSKQIRTENSTLNRFAEKADVIDQLEVIFNEPSDTGLNFNISEMFDAFQELSKNPESLNAKTVTVEKLKTLTETLNHMANQIERLEKETHDAIDKNVLDFNSKVEGLKTLNKQIFNISIKGQVPNDLLDQRDLMLKELSAIGEVDLNFDEYGRVGIKMGNEDILKPEGEQQFLGYNKELVGTDETRQIRIYESKEDAEKGEDDKGIISVKNGKILGNMDAIKDVKESKTNLNKMASTMAKAINKVHTTGGGGHIFVTSGGATEITAENIMVNSDMQKDPSLLKAGKTDEEGDGSLALELAGLRNTKVDESGTESSGGNTIGGSYRDIIVKIGISKEHADNMVRNQEVLANQLEMRRESVSGVSINDEITNIIKFQNAYDANAKVISVLAEMLDTLINRTGV